MCVVGGGSEGGRINREQRDGELWEWYTVHCTVGRVERKYRSKKVPWGKGGLEYPGRSFLQISTFCTFPVPESRDEG